MFPNTMPLVSGPSAPQAASTPTAANYTQAPSYLTPALGASQMQQASPYTQYQNATQDMQKQMQNMRLGGVGAMAQQPGGMPGMSPPGGPGQPGQPTQQGPFPQGAMSPPQFGGF